MKYLQLLARHHPDHVLPALLSFDFPLDESLELCQPNNLRIAAAHLKAKLGQNENAIQDYKQVPKANQIISDNLEKYLTSTEGNEAQYGFLSEAIFAYGRIESICEFCLKESPAEAKSLYFDFLGFILKYFLALMATGLQGSLERKIKVYELKSLLFSLFIEKTIISIAKNVGTEQLTDVDSIDAVVPERVGAHPHPRHR